MAFLTIHLAPDLTPAQRRQAARAGPPAVLARADHQELLAAAGFLHVAETDVTPDYLTSVRAWFDESATRECELRTALGDALFDERQSDRLAHASGIERGLLRRSLFVARRG